MPILFDYIIHSFLYSLKTECLNIYEFQSMVYFLYEVKS